MTHLRYQITSCFSRYEFLEKDGIYPRKRSARWNVVWRGEVFPPDSISEFEEKRRRAEEVVCQYLDDFVEAVETIGDISPEVGSETLVGLFLDFYKLELFETEVK